MKTLDRMRARKLHDQGVALSDAGKDDLALEKYFKALELNPARANTNYNIGLIYKYRARWQESFAYNRRAVDQKPDNEAANWNLAIAATALRDWQTARSVWHGLGLPIEPGDTPIEMKFGTTPVRLNPDDSAEVVWAQRIDPVRARLTNIPLPSSGFRFDDLVLHDGAPVGYRLDAQGRERSVFNALELFTASRFSTFEAELVVPSPEDAAALSTACEEAKLQMEDWTASIHYLCKACSEGRPHEQHDHTPAPQEWNAKRSIGFAAAEAADIERVLDNWARPGRSITNLEVALQA